ncbi:pilin [Corallococcus praedator]|uniref:Pilin n=1 Tax=Corallococcus praedator TaxID=2316724 RepID=A0ABX9Q8V0_9BACT|nr:MULTISPECIES: pilin [Corallococcus]RKH22384.1 pilin [Corallococcus sp. CA031C]RKH95537.1 pilin [Corallococcus praedator]
MPTMSDDVPAAPKKSVLPGVALGFAIASLCLGCFWPVAVVLSIVALVKAGKPGQSGKGLAIAALIVSVAAFFFIGIQAAIAIPNFIRFQARSKQAECKVNLKSIYLSAQARLAEEQPLGSLTELGFAPEPGNRYAYVLRLPDSFIPVSERFTAIDPSGIQTALENAGVEPGVQGECPECTLTAVCVGNVDNDDTLDVWSISTAERTDAKGKAIAPGEVFNHVNDVQE